MGALVFLDRDNWRLDWRDIIVMMAALAVTTALGVALRAAKGSESVVPLLFGLCVLVVSRLTEGFVCGVLSSLVAVLGVNYVFTYPYMAFNFTISGYPVTFAAMLAVSLSTCALTTQIKHEEKLKLEAEREKMRSNLLRAVSHDLRTPLTAIYGSVSAVLDNGCLSEDERRRLLSDVRSDSEWLIRMVENLLSITRIGDGDARIEKSPEPAEEILDETARKFRSRFPDVRLDISMPAEVLFVPMDPVLIEQVLINLLENAVEHGETTKNVRLSAARQDASAIFSVEDDGRGISRETEQRLFKDYFDQTQMSAGAGEKRNMGIGLAVCTTIIRAHGGTLKAENLSRGGARFYFTLPLE